MVKYRGLFFVFLAMPSSALIQRAIARSSAIRHPCGLVCSSGAASIPRMAPVATASSDVATSSKRRVVFLGTPEVAATALGMLIDASRTRGEKNDDVQYAEPSWEVSAVVTQPPALQGRGKKRQLTPSPVGALASKHRIPVMSPEIAKDPDFLTALEALDPDLCVTAAYGQWLPKRFLDCPKFGPLNIHPSLLPRWRGASPVQRALEAGDEEVGVSVLWTVAKMDAGPVAAQRSRRLEGHEQAPELLEELFVAGTEELLTLLPGVWAGDVTQPPPRGDGKGTAPQDEDLVVAADKISPDEAQVCFATDSALDIHNKCRAFSGWPGIWTLVPSGKLKIIETQLVRDDEGDLLSTARKMNDGPFFAERGGRMFAACGGGGVLELITVQPPGKRRLSARAYLNGLKGMGS